MEQADLLKKLVKALEGLGIPYLLTGSMASSVFGEPRYTHDIDVVVDITLAQVISLCAAFPDPEYYCSTEAAKQAVRDRFQFNILHTTSGLKVDVIVASKSDFDRSRLSRGIRLPAGQDFDAIFGSPEDIIVKKLEYYRDGGSEKHLRDIVGVLTVQGAQLIAIIWLDG